MSEVQIRRCEESDVAGVQQLFSKVNGDEIPDGLWQWKNLSNPAGGPFSTVAYDESKGAVVGYVGAIAGLSIRPIRSMKG